MTFPTDRPLTEDLQAYDQICQMVANGELCSVDGEPCDIVEYWDKYGEDADGNRGTWICQRACRKCGEGS